MIFGLYHSAAGMMTTEYRQSVLANNLANAETVGFKRDVATFAERLPATLAGLQQGASAVDLEGLSGGLWLGTTHTDFREGPKQPTGNWHDVALHGPGFFAVMAEGQTQFTRDGRMQMRSDGLLVAASDGAPILGPGGVPIRLNPHAADTAIDEHGQILQDGSVVARLGVTDVANYTALRKSGTGRFIAPEGAATEAPAALVQSGYVETSGVEPIAELVDLMSASRAYQVNARMIALQDETVSRLISSALRV